MLTVARLVHVISVQKTNQGIHAAGQLRLSVDAMAGPLEALDDHVATRSGGPKRIARHSRVVRRPDAAPAYTGADASATSSSMNTLAVSRTRSGFRAYR